MVIPQNHLCWEVHRPLAAPAVRRTRIRKRIAEKCARIWSSLCRPFDIAKQNPERSSNELGLFKPGKLGKSFQYLAVRLRQSDRGFLQVVWMRHNKVAKQYKCQIVWRVYGACRKLGRISAMVTRKHGGQPTEEHTRR
jgi:hypothetical protein